MKVCSIACSLLTLFLTTGSAESEKLVLRVGHFPNVTHAQGLVAHQLSRRDNGWFESRLGPDVEIRWFTYNAGPTAMEAMLAGTLDITYVGPNPTLNAYMRSRGEAVRVIAGSALGGSALVVRPDTGIFKTADFRGRTVATPQFGNTQDVACRVWLQKNGFRVTMTGGDVRVVPTANPDQFSLFQQGRLDAVWTVEPWVSRLELDAGGKVFVEETNAVTTLLVARTGFLEQHRQIVREFTLAHAELTQWMNEHPAEARNLVLKELEAETHREFPSNLLDRSWDRIQFTDQISVAPLKEFVESAQKVGFLKDTVPLDKLVVVP